VQRRIRGPQRRLDLRGRVGAGEREAEVAVASGSGTTGRPGGMVMRTSDTPGTARAASRPRTSRRVPAARIGSIITPDAPGSRA